MSAPVVHHGDCLDVLRYMPDASVDAICTDPPYGLGFMGKEWDSGKSFVERKAAKSNTFDHVGGNHNPTSSADAARTRRVESRKFGEWCEAWATECLRVLKPGGHMLAFGGTRTFHRLACAVEDAGFEVRDSIAWLYGSGFPKSLDVSKAIDKAAGAEREVVGPDPEAGRRNKATPRFTGEQYANGEEWQGASAVMLTAPATDAARTWQGWGTALKPAFEPIVVARKPLAGTVAQTVLAHGTGALNVDGCRVGDGADKGVWPITERRHDDVAYTLQPTETDATKGRWPANVVLDESQAEALDAQSGELSSGKMMPTHTTAGVDGRGTYGADAADGFTTMETYGDTGGASRFFYVAKADSGERVRVNGTAHPTVKPLALMRWLVRLVTPPGGTVLDPFAGSGTTVEAAILEGFEVIAIEREADYLPLIHQRIHRRRDPVAAVKATLEDAGLFELISEEHA